MAGDCCHWSGKSQLPGAGGGREVGENWPDQGASLFFSWWGAEDLAKTLEQSQALLVLD